MSRFHHQEIAYLWTRYAAKHARTEDLHQLDMAVARAHLAAARIMPAPKVP